MSGRRLFSSPVHTACFLLLLLLIALFFANCHANRSHQHCDQYLSSSCGNIHNISHPFRFNGDPENCRNWDYELACENNRPVLYLFSGKFYVQAINYNNYTIRLVDEGIQIGNRSSLPLHPFTYDNFTSQEEYPYHYNLVYGLVVVFMNCESQVNSPLYIETSSSSSSSASNNSSPRRQYSYVLLGNLDTADVADLCTIDKMTMAALLPLGESQAERNFSLLDVHNMLAYGFELSWQNSLCEKCRGGDYCQVDAVDYTVICNKNCYGPLFNSSFQCVLEMIVQSFIIPGLQITVWIFAARTSCGILCLFAFLIYKFKRRHLSMFDTIEGFLQSQNNLMPIRYSYSNIKKMTKGFKDKLGEGGYGSVYKGKLRSGNAVAIKILGKSKANGQDFINEVATIGRIHHVNVVQLIGFCAERSKRALVYDFMPNGSLEKYICSHQEGSTSLSCKQMFEISLGVARGIEYLHRGCDMQILHFDIKPHNILLDENFTPKVSDFGLAKLYPTENSIVSLTAARGTMGYMAPELFYKNIGPISYKADVYSFGMLLMEMAGRRRNLNVYADHASQIYFPSWVYDQFKEGKDVEMGEATEEERQMVKKMIITALWCIQMKPSDRPSMNKVVEMLEGNIELLEMPPKPFLTPQEMPAAAEDQ